MTEDEDFTKLSIEQLCYHKSWKARLLGYTQMVKKMSEIYDEKSNDWNSYSGMFKLIFTDSNVMCQEKGLEAILMFVENSAFGGKVLSDVASGIIQKHLAAPKARLRELGTNVLLMYVEVEKQAAVVDEILKGIDSKNQKIRSACIQVLTQIIMEFGPKVISVEKIVKKMENTIEDKDPTVRQDTKQLIATLYLWMGSGVKMKMSSFKPNQLTDIEEEYNKIKSTPPTPKRYLRSQQSKINLTPKKTSEPSIVQAPKIDKTEDEDPYESVNPIDVLCHINEEFYKKLEATKWSERRDALEDFNKILEGAKKLENGDYNELIRVLKNIVTKDSNILVVISALKCLTGLSKGLRKDFKQYSASVMPILFGKFKEKKQNVVLALREAVDAVFLSTNFELLQESILPSLEDKNPSVKAEVTGFLTRSIKKTPSNIINNKKCLKAYTTSLSNLLRDQDPLVRENSAAALGVLMLIYNEKTIRPLLKDVDDTQMKKIRENMEKLDISLQSLNNQTEVHSPINNTEKNVKEIVDPKVQQCKANFKKESTFQNNEKKEKTIKASNKRQGINENNKAQEVPLKTDIRLKINDGVLGELANKNWQVRLEAISKLQAIVNQSETPIAATIGSIDSILAERIQDNNNKVSQSATELVKKLVIAMGPQSKRHLPVFMPVLLKMIGDQKSGLRSSVLSCLSSWGEVCGLEKLLEGPAIVDALKYGTPSAQAEIWTWLGNVLPKIASKTVPDMWLTALLEPMFSHFEARHGEVRKKAAEACAGLMSHIGYKTMVDLLESMNLSKHASNSIQKILENARNSLPVPEILEESNYPKPIKKQNSTSSVSSNKKKPTSQKNVEKLENKFVIEENNLKPQRLIDNEKIRHNSRTPKSEVIDHLKNVMISAKFDSVLISDMFHSDFRFHIRALDKLLEELSQNKGAVKCNLDILLQWLGLNLSETNPSVIMKQLEYLKKVFEMLTEDGYHLLNSEAVTTMLYLVPKLSDTKDTIRSGVQSILKLAALLHPPRKQLPFLIEGLKSKNVRQRLECVEHINWLVVDFDTKICHQMLTTLVRRMAAILEERDFATKKAALNFLVKMCLKEGDKVFHELEKISDKTLLLVKDKIKRGSVCRVSPLKKDGYVEIPAKISIDDSMSICSEISDVKSVELEVLTRPICIKNNDAAPVENYDEESYKFEPPKLIDIDLSFMTGNSPEKFAEATRKIINTPQKGLKLSSKAESLVESIFNNANKGIALVSNLNESEIGHKTGEIKEIIDELITDLMKLLVEFKHEKHPNIMGYYTATVYVINNFFAKKSISSQITEEKLAELYEEILSLVNAQKCLDFSKATTEALYNLVFTILENANKTYSICVLIMILNLRAYNDETFSELISRFLRTLEFNVHEDDLDCQKIIHSIDGFLNRYPKEKLKSISVDNPLRAVQSLLKKIIRSNGKEVVEIAENLPKDSDIFSMIMEMWKEINKDEIFNDPNEKSHEGRKTKPLEPHSSSESSSYHGSQSASSNNSDEEKKEISAEIKGIWGRLCSLKKRLGLLKENEQEDFDQKLQDLNTKPVTKDPGGTKESIEDIKERLARIQAVIGT